MVGLPINRQNSHDSTCSNLAGGGGDDDSGFVPSRRPTHSGAVLGALDPSAKRHEAVDFEKPELGFRGAMAMMNELSKCVDRLKADLFVIRFAPPGSSNGALSSGAGKRRKSDEEASSVAAADDEEAEDRPAEVKPRGGKGFRGKATAYLRRIKSGNLEDLDEYTISDGCLALLRGLAHDTSDPDAVFSSPFVDTRHTLLEMCQFRHYQFDTLRRAKHSSLMLLYHLHNPHARFLRPKCKMCLEQIVDVRWHCGDGCADYDVCGDCYSSHHARGQAHHPGHKLTPFRVTFE